MFKATVVASKLREEMAHYFGLIRGSGVLQVLHRGEEVKVVMTQAHYLDLLSQLAIYENGKNAKTVPAKWSRSIEDAIRAKLAEAGEDEASDDSRRVGQRRAR